MSSVRSAAAHTGSPARLEHLLQTTSRTFALTIPLLNEPLRQEVTLAYLLFRVADTLEDSTLWSGRRKLAELERLAILLESPSEAAAAESASRWAADPPLDHAAYNELLSDLPMVLRAAGALAPDAWKLIATHTARTSRAMSSFVAREEDGVLRLRDLDDLKAYCYAVAGIVGEMLTELFILRSRGLGAIASQMREEAATFGEALQLVNIQKDCTTDAIEGRYYLPGGLPREDVLSLARRDLATAAGYSARLERARADKGIVAFTALPVLLARATLDQVERRGPGAKVSRHDVAAILARLHAALDRGTVATLLNHAEEDRLEGGRHT
jgi:farnesyl-diphosphate farnesyltransferase